MVGKTFVSLLVQSELLAFMLLHTARNLILLSVFIRIITHSHHIFFVVSHGQSVKHRGCAVAKRHIIYCVKHISFAFAVLANQTIDLGRKFKVGGSNILVINQRQPVKYHIMQFLLCEVSSFPLPDKPCTTENRTKEKKVEIKFHHLMRKD